MRAQGGFVVNKGRRHGLPVKLSGSPGKHSKGSFSGLAAQTVTTGPVTFPKDATALEGLPQIRIDTNRDSATRRPLDPECAS